ncbi:hypothetical protein BJY04DRAFT_179670 [Aspergillus karnatakaensis]|uniref:uncharacterized protein n=1 Tax=Aspergillus karnatakaensis TaxID=1810916 RepID=UPI003CCCDED0
MYTTPWRTANIPSPLPEDAQFMHGFTLHGPSSSDLWEAPGSDPTFTAPMIYQAMPVQAFRRVRVTVTAELAHLYAQGGVALIIHRADGSRAWLKTGVEFVDGRQVLCTVGKDRNVDCSYASTVEHGEEVTIEVERGGCGVVVYKVDLDAGTEGGKENRTVVRDLAWVVSGDQMEECWIGVYVAKPLGDAGDPDVVVKFRELVIERRDIES